MENVIMRDCRIITIPEENKSFIIFIGAEITFINSNAYKHSGMITSIIPEGLFYTENEENGTGFIEWSRISDILSVDTGNVLDFLK